MGGEVVFAWDAGVAASCTHATKTSPTKATMLFLLLAMSDIVNNECFGR